jgi:xanthine dehydrogenase accessory factor
MNCGRWWWQRPYFDRRESFRTKTSPLNRWSFLRSFHLQIGKVRFAPTDPSAKLQHVRFGSDVVLIRGGGDLATGVAARLVRAGFPVVICELPEPLAVRRTVALSSAVVTGVFAVEEISARLVDIRSAVDTAQSGVVAVVVSADLPTIDRSVVVDARVAKRNLDTTINDAALVVGLGPGFTSGVDCHAVVETNRGHRLGRVMWAGSAEPDTGTPGLVAGRASERVLRAPIDGTIRWTVDIGSVVATGMVIGYVDRHEIVSPFDGMVRGLIRAGAVHARLKVADIDARVDPAMCHEISDKALAVGGGVLEAVLVWMNGRDGAR